VSFILVLKCGYEDQCAILGAGLGIFVFRLCCCSKHVRRIGHRLVGHNNQ
jgi:hypothetical protein